MAVIYNLVTVILPALAAATREAAFCLLIEATYRVFVVILQGNMVSSQRRKQLSDARAARKPRTKRQKLDVTTQNDWDEVSFSSAPSTQSDLDQNDDESSSVPWYWNNSSEDDISDSEEEGRIISESDSEPEPDVNTTTPSILPSTQRESPTLSNALRWKTEKDNHFRGAWGAGSESTTKRQARDAKERQKQASESYNIKAMMERGKAIATKQAQDKVQAEGKAVITSSKAELVSNMVSLPAGASPPISHRQAFKNL